jgi:predicted metal-dependent hydrolase
VRSSLYPVQELRRRTLGWAVKLRVNPTVIRVQEMRWKWGSCSSQGTVTLAIDLAEKDERFQDFVIVHELLHLRVPTHGRLFKTLMNAYVPGWGQFEVARNGRNRPRGSAVAR